MTDFAVALKEGFESAQRAVNARKEIDEVFGQLDRQVKKATRGKLSIDRVVRPADQPVLKTLVDAFSFPRKPIQEYTAIVAFNTASRKDSVREIATWSQASKGYPCKIWWAGEDHICDDKEGLANCLADLLRDPDVAAILLRVKNWRPKEQEASDTETSGGPISSDHTAGQETASDLPEAP